jgi:alpha-methylacyl-CoA racemase
VMQPAPAPRFSRTPLDRPTAPQEVGRGTRTTLADWGIPTERIAALLAGGTVIEPAQETASAE